MNKKMLLTNIEGGRDSPTQEPSCQTTLRFQDRCNTNRTCVSKELEHKKGLGESGEKEDIYRRVTRLAESQVTWNQVQGSTRVGSQLCNTLFGSFTDLLKAYKASPMFIQALPHH